MASVRGAVVWICQVVKARVEKPRSYCVLVKGYRVSATLWRSDYRPAALRVAGDGGEGEDEASLRSLSIDPLPLGGENGRVATVTGCSAGCGVETAVFWRHEAESCLQKCADMV